MKDGVFVNLRVWGDYACFTRPEMKVERVSYPVPTPSAARGILEAVYWEPAFHYVVDRIGIVKPGRWTSVRRNEVIRVISLDTSRKAMKGNKTPPYIQAGGGAADGTQRNMLALADVEYLIVAEIRLSQLARPPRDNLAKAAAQFRRRATSGRCHHRPSLGCREFAADFEWVENVASVRLSEWDQPDPGLMLYDVFDPADRSSGFAWFDAESEYVIGMTPPEVSTAQKAGYFGSKSKPRPCFFEAKVEEGWMDCHPDRMPIRRYQGEEV